MGANHGGAWGGLAHPEILLGGGWQWTQPPLKN